MKTYRISHLFLPTVAACWTRKRSGIHERILSVQVFVTRMHIIVAHLLSGKCLRLSFKPSSEVVMRHNVSSLREANL